MKLSESRVDPIKVEQGDWVRDIPEMGDLAIKTRGANNATWRNMMNTLVKAVPRSKKIGGILSVDEQDRINAILLREAGILDWENLTDDDDQPILYSKETAGKYLNDPQYRAFFDAALYAANVVGKDAAEAVEADSKNSAKS